MDYREHWEKVYSRTPLHKVGWYRPHLETSFDWITHLPLSADSPIIDVGCGASTLIDDLLHHGFQSITAVDLSAQALAVLQERLGYQAKQVTFIQGDITSISLPGQAFQLWHDRAVFHFLTQKEARESYVRQVLHALQPGGYLLIATFAPEAPPKCSGLPVQRYDVPDICQVFSPHFQLQRHQKERHITPGGVEQMYLYCLFQRVD